jgi:hypothetical protein
VSYPLWEKSKGYSDTSWRICLAATGSRKWVFINLRASRGAHTKRWYDVVRRVQLARLFRASRGGAGGKRGRGELCVCQCAQNARRSMSVSGYKRRTTGLTSSKQRPSNGGGPDSRGRSQHNCVERSARWPWQARRLCEGHAVKKSASAQASRRPCSITDRGEETKNWRRIPSLSLGSNMKAGSLSTLPQSERR